jgi:hypothetical protein
MTNKLINWLLGKQEEAKKDKPAQQDNVVVGKRKLLNVICGFSKQFFGKTEFTDTVVVWVANSQPAYQNFVRETNFETEVRAALQNKQLTAVSKAKFEFKTENPPAELALSAIADGVYIQLVAPQKAEKMLKEVFSKAKISISDGKGSLAQSEYLLDAAKHQTFNIGRGTDFNNFVVIDGESELNSNVSRQHAKIVFIADKGFFLQSRNTSNRTIINRNFERFADLKDLYTKIQLKDGDEIELGKSVCLKFEILKEK